MDAKGTKKCWGSLVFVGSQYLNMLEIGVGKLLFIYDSIIIMDCSFTTSGNLSILCLINNGFEWCKKVFFYQLYVTLAFAKPQVD